MADLTRRRFLATSSVGLTAVVGAAVVAGPQLAAHLGAFDAGAGLTSPGEPMVVHVRDVSTAEIALMVGTTQVVYRDRELVQRLLTAARQAPANPRVR